MNIGRLTDYPSASLQCVFGFQLTLFKRIINLVLYKSGRYRLNSKAGEDVEYACYILSCYQRSCILVYDLYFGLPVRWSLKKYIWLYIVIIRSSEERINI